MFTAEVEGAARTPTQLGPWKKYTGWGQNWKPGGKSTRWNNQKNFKKTDNWLA